MREFPKRLSSSFLRPGTRKKRNSRRSRNSARERNAYKPRLVAETLEERILLSISAPSLAAEPPSLLIDLSDYDASSILVRFQPEAGCEETVCRGLAGTSLPGSINVDLSFSTLAGLRAIDLPEGIDVESALAIYRSNPAVLYAEPNYRIRITATPDDPSFDALWGLNNAGQTGGTLDADVDAPEAWDITTGSGSTIVAVIDTGVDYTHEDLAANMWVNLGEVPGDGIDNDLNGYIDDVHGYDFFNNDPDPMDDNNHGTHVAGTIGAVGNNGIGVTGVNWDVQIMALKFLGADGSGDLAAAIAAIDYAVANGATLSNNSWGFNGGFSQALFDAIESAGQVGHVFMAAAGNGNAFGLGQDNDFTPFYPSSYDLDNIVAVAALDDTDNRAIFSNFGATSVDLGAPGVSILSTTPNNTYSTFSGTSMATPLVTGVAALVKSVHPEWTSQEVIDQLLLSVDPVAALQGITVTGGRLNAAAAVGNPIPPPPPPPSTSLPVSEDFEDGVADFFEVVAGTWNVDLGRYHVSPSVGGDGVATLRIDETLPSNLELKATINADAATGSFLSNALVIFDYQGPSDFKFAGAYAGANRWLIGERTALGWFDVAAFSETIAASTDYQLQLTIENDSDVTLSIDGVTKVIHSFTESVTDGDVGVGTRNAVSHFDNVLVQQFVPPPPLPPGTLPVNEDFEDGVADFFDTPSGIWQVSAGRYNVTPSVGNDGISTLRLDSSLPPQVELAATINADAVTAGFLSNAFLIFDYQGPTDFKFAGAYAGVDRWLMGHRSSTGWVEEVSIPEIIDASRDYRLGVVLDGNNVTFTVDGLEKLSHGFSDIVTDGLLGVGTENAISHFDDVVAQAFVPPPPPPSGTLPILEDFDDGLADFFEVRSGSWVTSGGRYDVTPVAAGDGISTVRVDAPLPADLELQATINADAVSGAFLSNAFVIFDYQGATDFKFAGAYAGTDQWLIGHRTSTAWVADAIVSDAIDAGTDYSLQVVLHASGEVTLSANGTAKLTHTFTDTLTDGDVGVGTRNAVSHFDDVVLQAFVPPPPPPSGTLPITEDFEDGIADFFEVLSGSWVVSGGRYDVTPVVGNDAISTLRVDAPLPADLELETTINANSGAGGFLSNAMLIFDYQGPTDFKFAGAYAGSNQWLIGHRTSSAWVADATVGDVIDAGTDYSLQVVLGAGGDVTLSVDGTAKLTHTFADTLTDGDVGVGTRNAVSHFDDVVLQEFVPPPPPPLGTLPITEDYEDGIADFFEVLSGSWVVSGGRYHVTPVVGNDAISTLRFDAPLPADLELETTINADPGTGGFLSNAMLIFDYQGPTDFKFAGAYVGANRWLIGHRTTAGWIEDATRGQGIKASTDYGLQVVISGGTNVTLLVDGVTKITHTFADLVTDGDVGVGTRYALSRFDDVAVRQGVEASGLPTGAAAKGDSLVPDGLGAFTLPPAATASEEPFGASSYAAVGLVDSGGTVVAGPADPSPNPSSAALSSELVDQVLADFETVTATEEPWDALDQEMDLEVSDEALLAALLGEWAS